MMLHPFQGELVLIRNGQWTEQVSLQVSSITQCLGRELLLNDNQRAKIVKEIAHIHFTALTYLELSDNRIEFVEGLARVHMAHIEVVILQYNYITSVVAIRKAAWPDLKSLTIANNYIGDANSLVHGCFPRMKKLLAYLKWGYKNQFTEQCFPAKMQAASLQYLCIQKSKFCFGRCLKRVLQQRWSHIKIY